MISTDLRSRDHDLRSRDHVPISKLPPVTTMFTPPPPLLACHIRKAPDPACHMRKAPDPACHIRKVARLRPRPPSWEGPAPVSLYMRSRAAVSPRADRATWTQRVLATWTAQRVRGWRCERVDEVMAWEQPRPSEPSLGTGRVRVRMAPRDTWRRHVRDERQPAHAYVEFRQISRGDHPACARDQLRAVLVLLLLPLSLLLLLLLLSGR